MRAPSKRLSRRPFRATSHAGNRPSPCSETRPTMKTLPIRLRLLLGAAVLLTGCFREERNLRSRPRGGDSRAHGARLGDGTPGRPGNDKGDMDVPPDRERPHGTAADARRRKRGAQRDVLPVGIRRAELQRALHRVRKPPFLLLGRRGADARHANRPKEFHRPRSGDIGGLQRTHPVLRRPVTAAGGFRPVRAVSRRASRSPPA